MLFLQSWMSCSLVWILCCCCLPLILLAVPMPPKGAGATNHVCKLEKIYFQQPYIRNRTYTLAKEARLLDQDTENRFIGQQLYVNVKETNRCYVMKSVLEIIVKEVLSDLKNKNPYIHEVIYFLEFLRSKLHGCNFLGNREHVEKNLAEMKNRMKQLGENGKNKAIGELDLLFDYMEDACIEGPKKGGHKKNH
ncbi:PREDICTED: interleukin-22 [Gavialis gangeticus]|uniref:interleukin-22 n=1 Tax=Gavialis gangeticus TaxID=94835 RepID=UPI00092EA5C2|nr:PREDICTED: interleukin-22 [Gavialis gangeticus]